MSSSTTYLPRPSTPLNRFSSSTPRFSRPGTTLGQSRENPAYSSFGFVKDLKGGDYCDPKDPCCAKPDPEISLHRYQVSGRRSRRRQCAPKNPFHFVYSINHRQKMKKTLQAVVERQDQGVFLVDKKASKKVSVNPSTAYFSNNPDKLPYPPKDNLIDAQELSQLLQGMGNMALAHEIALNKDVKFSKEDQPLNKQAKIALQGKSKYWQKTDQVLIRKRKHQKEVKNIIVDLVCTLKRMLLGTILPQNKTIRYRIDRELNLTKIKKEIDLNSFDMRATVTFILDTLSVLCCPIRDKEILDLRDMIQDQVPWSRLAKNAIDLMEQMNLDMANFILSQSRPFVVQNCVEYERTQFANFVESQYRNGRDPLQLTRHWILSHCIPERDFKQVMAWAFWEILENEERNTIWPETLALDWFRFAPIRHEIRRLSILGAVIASVYDYSITLQDSMTDVNNFEQSQVLVLKNLRFLSYLREEINGVLVFDYHNVGTELYKILDKCCARATQVVDHYLVSERCEGLTQLQQQIITGLVMSCGDINYPTRKLYHSRIKEWFLHAAQDEGHGVLQVPPNLHVIGPLLLPPITSFIQLVTYNRCLFDMLYQEIYSGNCPPPQFPPTSDPSHTVVLDANNPDATNTFKMDPGIASLIQKLRSFNDRSMVYRKSHLNPKIQPMYYPDGSLIIPPEYRKTSEHKLTPLQQKHYDEYLLKNESTLDIDYDGVYNPSVKPDDPGWILDQTSEQLIRLMERESIIKANKLRRIKKRIEQETLRKRVEENIPIFEKVWREEFDHLQKEFCRLQRIQEKGSMSLPQNAQDEPTPRRTFKGACELRKGRDVDKFPKYNEKGEKLIYSRNRGASFATPAKLKEKVEYDFSRYKPDEDGAGEGLVDPDIHGYSVKTVRYY